MQEPFFPEKTKDFFKSQEEFLLVRDEKFGFLKTQPVPNDLESYYQSDDYISHTDSKRSVFEFVYQAVKSIALRSKRKLVNQYAQHKGALLDVGCGTGDFLHEVAKDGWKVAGVEPNEKACAIAEEKTQQKIYPNLSGIETGQNFDVITLWHVLEHLPELHEEIDRLKAHLTPEGRLLVAVPNFECFDAKYYKQFWAAYDVPRHLWHFNKESLIALMHFHGLKVATILPMRFDAYYVSLLSEKYKSGWMNIFRACVIALRSNLAAKSNNNYSSLIYVIQKDE